MELTTVTAPSKSDALETLRKIAGKTGDLPPFPATAMTVVRMTEDPRVSARDLQAVISRDQSLCARVLRVVNSPIYGLRAEISTVSHAVAILGLDVLRTTVVTATVQQLYAGVKVVGHGLTSKLLADHSWGSAVTARKVAARIRYPNLEEAFLCGLMHDIGKIVLLKNFPTRYNEIISEAYRGETASSHEVELAAFGFSHAHVGALLAERWNFPPQLCEAILYHHEPLSAPTHFRLAGVTAFADAVMAVLEIGIHRNAQLDLGSLVDAGIVKLEKTAIEELIAELRALNLCESSPLAR
jgi:putative nucleotidyltransferase with HDIG domain